MKSLAKAKLQVSVDDRKIRVKFLLVAFAAGIAMVPAVVFVARNLDLRNHRERFSGDQLLNSIGCHKQLFVGWAHD